MEIIQSSVLYENPLPQLKSRQSFFPSLCQLSDGIIAASFVIVEAFESVDSTSYICFSQDEGATWSEPKKMFSLAGMHPRITDYCKITALPDGRIAALGYAYLRSDPSLPIGNPEMEAYWMTSYFVPSLRIGGNPGAIFKKSHVPGDRT